MNEKLYNIIKEYVPYDEKEKVDQEVMLDFIKNNLDVLTRNNKIGHFRYQRGSLIKNIIKY